MQINRVSFGGMGNVDQAAYFEKLASRSESSHYPVGGGKVDRIRYESEHGWDTPSNNRSADVYVSREERDKYDTWYSNWHQATCGGDLDF